jgi:hypothetical protein
MPAAAAAAAALDKHGDGITALPLIAACAPPLPHAPRHHPNCYYCCCRRRPRSTSRPQVWRSRVDRCPRRPCAAAPASITPPPPRTAASPCLPARP